MTRITGEGQMSGSVGMNDTINTHHTIDGVNGVSHHTMKGVNMNDAKDEEDDIHVSVSEHVDVSTLSIKDDVHVHADGGTDNGTLNDKKEQPMEESKTHDITSVDASTGCTSSSPPSTGFGSPSFYDVRVAVVGNVDSGKSTLVGVLTGGKLDDGRGSARSRVFVHQHELANGRTSCISQHVMGIDADGSPVHQLIAQNASSVAKTKSWSHVVSHSRSVVTLIDLAGHERYLKTTIAGLTGLFPDYAFVIVNSLAGITKMTKEHLGCVIALDLPLVVIVTKIDLVPGNVLENTKKTIDRILKSNQCRKMPIHVKSMKDVDTATISTNQNSTRLAPIFYVSSVTGSGLDLLNSWLSKAKPRLKFHNTLAQPPALDIDETFLVTGVGTIVSGTLTQGKLRRDEVMLLGPFDTPDIVDQWRKVVVRSIHCKRVAVDEIQAGTSCAMSLRAVKAKDRIERQSIRRGMVLLHPSIPPHSSRCFEAEVLILHHPTTIQLGYQAVIHAGIVRQTATLVYLNAECLRTGDRATCRFRFLMREEYVRTGTVFVFREGSTKGMGRITKTQDQMDPADVQACLDAPDKNRKDNPFKANTSIITTHTNAAASSSPHEHHTNNTPSTSTAHPTISTPHSVHIPPFSTTSHPPTSTSTSTSHATSTSSTSSPLKPSARSQLASTPTRAKNKR